MAGPTRLRASLAPSTDVLATPATAGGSNDIWDHMRTVVRHRWWALAGGLLLAVPIGVNTQLSVPVYLATTRVLASDNLSPPEVSLGASGRPDNNRSVLDPQTQTEVVRNRALARDVVTALKLWEAEEYRPVVVGATTDEERIRRLIEPFLAHVVVQVIPASQVFSIAVESTDPELAARAANALATRYIERDRESRYSASSTTTDWLAERLAEQRKQVEASETALQTYRATRDALSLSDRQNIVVQKLADLNASVTKAKTDRILKEAQFRQIEAIGSDLAALESNPLIASSDEVQALRTTAGQLARQDAELANRLGPKHPERVQVMTALEQVQGRLRAEVNKVVAGIQSDYQSAVAQEQGLTAALNQQKSEAFSLDKKGVEYAALEREAASARQVYDALLQQTKQAALQTDVQSTGLRIVDAAVAPGAPIRPRKAQGFAIAALLGLLGAGGAAFGREFMRRRVQSVKDVEQRLGLPVLSLVPTTAWKEAMKVGSLSPVAAEAFRRLRANVMLACSDGQQPGNVLVVTSAAPGEGKSFVATHLAAALAMVDQRVALIDADMRRPRIHEMFDRQRAPGLADVLLGRRSTAEVLRPVGPQGLVLVPSGIPTNQASELLSLQAFRNLINDLRSDFDWIVIDSPPVAAVADATVLGHDATAVLFVTSADVTSLEAAETALSDLDASGCRLLGAVLNRAPLTREAFYYSRYYRPEYSAYMSPEQPEPEPGKVRVAQS